MSKAERRGLSVEAIQNGGVEEVPNLSLLIWQRIATSGKSMAAFARSMPIDYLLLSRLIEKGVPPDDHETLERLRIATDLDEATFGDALKESRRNPKPVPTSRTDAFLNNDSHPLQRALVDYMRQKKYTLKKISELSGLSQVTVSRVVKQGQMPTRAVTHQKTSELAGFKCFRVSRLT